MPIKKLAEKIFGMVHNRSNQLKQGFSTSSDIVHSLQHFDLYKLQQFSVQQLMNF